MGTPRLGDDALAYMWVGNNSVLSPKLDMPALQTILEIRGSSEALSDELDIKRARVTMRTTGVYASPLYVLIGGLQSFGLDHKVVFAIFEVTVASVLTFAIAFSLLKFAGSAAATFVLFVTAFMIFPNQGLHFLIPGVFALSLALLQFHLVLSDGRINLYLLIFITLTLLLVHPIGQVYTLFIFSISLLKTFLSNKYCLINYAPSLSLVFSAILWSLVVKFSGEVSPPTTGMGGLSFSNAIFNLSGLYGILSGFIVEQSIFSLAIFLGLINAWFIRKTLPNLSIITLGLFALMMSAVLVDLPVYPAELSSRIFVLFSLISLASFAVGALSLNKPYIIYLFGLIIFMMAVPRFYDLGMLNMNKRDEIYDSKLLNNEIAGLPSNASIVWMDSDNALMAGLIEGAYKHRAVPISMLANAEDIFDYVDRDGPVYLAGIPPKSLNGIAAKNFYSPSKRFYGYGYSEYSRLTIKLYNDHDDSIFVKLRVNSLGDISAQGEGGSFCSIQKLEDVKNWYRVSGCEKSRSISFVGQSEDAAFIGISLDYPNIKKSWPWGTGIKLTALPINKSSPVVVRFSYDFLFNSKLSPALQNQFDEILLLSDNSGLVWMKAFPKSVNED